MAHFVGERTIHLSARAIGNRPPDAKAKKPPRARRQATVRLRFIKLELQPPRSVFPTKALHRPSIPQPVPATAIEVVELEPPEGEQPVRWVLLTSEVVDDIDGLLRVVDLYRSRWLIEEYFKALKTGCAYQKRQMASADTLLRTLAILIPVAWRLLVLRHLSRHTPDEPYTVVLTPIEFKVLRARMKKVRWSAAPTVAEATAAIARLGGHTKARQAKRRRRKPGKQSAAGESPASKAPPEITSHRR